MVDFYPKINGPYKRHNDGPNKGDLIMGDWACPEFDFLQFNTWEFIEKIDGTNIIIDIRRSEDWLHINYYGRTANAVIPKPLLARLEDLFPATKSKFNATPREILVGRWMLDKDIDNITLYGEGIGGKIQSGRYGPEFDFVLFDVKIGQFWLTYDNVLDVADNLELSVAPHLGMGDLHDGFELVKDAENFKSVFNEGGYIEGIIARPELQLFNRKGERVTTKIKVRDFQ